MSTLSGHKGTVLCLSVSNTTLASGSEDKSVRVWDIKSRKVIRALVGFTDDVSAICFHDTGNLISAAAGTVVKTFDLRMDGIVLSQCEWSQTVSIDEINDLDVKNGVLIAASDSGAVSLRRSETGDVYCDDLSGIHTNLVTCARAIPGQDKVISGGLDCSVVLWEMNGLKGQKISLGQPLGQSLGNAGSIVSSHLGNAGDAPIDAPVSDNCEDEREDDEVQHVSPPMVHGIDVSRCGCMAAAALGNSTIPVFSLRPDSLWSVVATCRGGLTLGHRSTVVQAKFPIFGDPDWLVSGGNDGQVILWHLQHTCVDLGCDWQPTHVDTDEDEDALPAWVQQHPEKINAIDTIDSGGGVVAVADVGDSISLYEIPS